MGKNQSLPRSVAMAVALAAAISVSGLLPSPAAAADVARYSFSGSQATAYFSFTDGYCIQTYANVQAVVGRTKDSATGHTSSATAWLAISNYNYCDGTFVDAYGQLNLAPDEFTVQRDLSSASLNATVDVYDYYSGQTRPVQVSLTWSANGARSTGSYVSRSRSGGTMSVSRFSGASRPAVASGTILDGALDLTGGTLSNDAAISSVKNGSLTITR